MTISFKSFITENFNWDNRDAEDLAKTFNSLIKYNDGFFKSEKQSGFLMNYSKPTVEGRRDYDSLKKYFGVDVKEGQVAFVIGGTAHWADYGTKSIRPVNWVFVIDDFGVVGKYKLKYQGDTRSGTAPDPQKTTAEWTRTDLNKKPEWASDENRAKVHAEKEQKVKDQESKAAKLLAYGKEGDKIENIETTIKDIAFYGYNDFGAPSYRTVLTTSTGDLIYWYNMPKGKSEDNVGEKITLKKATIKKITKNKQGDPVLVIIRPTFG